MSQAKERPILFSGPMVRAILEGRKTVTRRPVKGGQIPRLEYPDSPEPWIAVGQHHPRYGFVVHGKTERECAVKVGELGACPFGEPGDRLWVREAWLADAQLDSIVPRDLSQGEPIMYPADGSVRQTGCAMVSQGRGRPSIHMPRWASRILLEITAVRVEHLQDISDDQAKAEGMVYTDFGMQERPGKVSLDGGKTFHPMKPQQAPGWHAGDATQPDQCLDRARWAFANLWEKINGEYSWDANPWVWVVEFKRIEQ